MNGGNWRVAAASVIGAAHLAQDTICQDRFACETIKTAADGAVLIAAVADGAGSASDGQVGAEIACDFFVRQIAEFLRSKNASVKSLDDAFGKFWIEHFQQRISDRARENEKIVRDYASTLIGAIVGAKAAVFYQVGDGAAVYSISGKPESYRFAIAPTEAEYVNVTEFLTDADAAEKLRCARVGEAIEDTILFSDGIFAVAVNFETNAPHEPFLMPMIAPLRRGDSANNLDEKLVNYLSSPKLNEKTDDDKTLILASRHQTVQT